MEHNPASKFKIERRISWLGLFIFLTYAIIGCIALEHLLPHKWHRFGFLGAVIVGAIQVIHQRYWSAGIKEGVRFIKLNQWENAYTIFAAAYVRFRKNKFIDKYRYWLLASISASSFQAMALRDMAFCQLMMKNKELASFYYKDLLELPGGRELALPLLKHFE
ncbi:hypothetical protein ACTHGU_00570 [Chitinophagaceae bacterium MMS25-I14]